MELLPRLAVIGLGNMGEALLRGLLEHRLTTPERVLGVEKLAERAHTLSERYGIAVHARLAQGEHPPELVLLAVKPQDVGAALAEVASLGPGPVLVSVCAGVRLASLATPLPPGAAVVRAMPNTPALVGCGASVYCCNEHLDAARREQVERLLGAVGSVHQVAAESLLDAVTGLSGSGPAYVFAFLEALADGGVLMGLPRDLARDLAAQTVLGAARLVQESAVHTAELRDRVTSPGGTTSAGLHQLELHGFRGAVLDAVRAATLRCRELGD